MKVVLETIPVWDAFKKETECPVCALMEEAEKDGISYYLSSAIMTPEVRVETNDKGFLPTSLHSSFPRWEATEPSSCNGYILREE